MNDLQGIGLIISGVLTAIMPLILWQLNRIHTIVNSRTDALMERVNQLENKLTKENITIPEKYTKP